jgi:hypothetical protein
VNGPLREAAVTDPDWARKEYRREILVKVVTAGVLLALALGVLTIIQNRSQDTRITNVTRTVESACEVDANGSECERVTCSQFRSVARGDQLLRLTRCGVAERRVALAREVGDTPSGVGVPAPTAEGGSDGAPLPGVGANKPPKSPSKPAEPRHEPSPAPAQAGSEDGAAPAQAGSEDGAAPVSAPSPTGAAPPAGASVSAPPPVVIVTPPVIPSQPSTLPATVEATGKAAGEVVSQAGSAVNGTVEGVSDAGCRVLGRC